MTPLRRWLYYSYVVRNIVCLGSEVLSRPSLPVEKFDEELRSLVDDLFDTLDTRPGIGLSACQIGVLKRVFVVRLDDGVRRVFVNPQITGTSAETSVYEEGCLSIPEIWGDVVRPKSVSMFAYDQNGRPFNIDAEGLLARCVQHENDHLDGRLFIDRLPAETRERLVRKYERRRAARGRRKR